MKLRAVWCIVFGSSCAITAKERAKKENRKASFFIVQSKLKERLL
jgi:hypothetical protein